MDFSGCDSLWIEPIARGIAIMQGTGHSVCFQILGRVQGVGFRYYTLRKANEFGVSGWVRNEPDGSVLIQARMHSEALVAFRQALAKGPAFSRVDEVRETTSADPNLVNATEFRILR